MPWIGGPKQHQHQHRRQGFTKMKTFIVFPWVPWTHFIAKARFGHFGQQFVFNKYSKPYHLRMFQQLYEDDYIWDKTHLVDVNRVYLSSWKMHRIQTVELHHWYSIHTIPSTFSEDLVVESSWRRDRSTPSGEVCREFHLPESIRPGN